MCQRPPAPVHMASAGTGCSIGTYVSSVYYAAYREEDVLFCGIFRFCINGQKSLTSTQWKMMYVVYLRQTHLSGRICQVLS